MFVVIAGPANTYGHYVTTREEYSVQRYEGASTLYGPCTFLLAPALLMLLSYEKQSHLGGVHRRVHAPCAILVGQCERRTALGRSAA